MKSQPVARHLEIQRLAAILSDGFLHTFARTFFNESNHASSAAGAANLGGARTLLPRGRNQLIDKWCRDSRSVGAAQLPLCLQQTLDVVPFHLCQSAVHRLRYARNLGEIADDMLVTVDVLLEYLPIVDSRLAWRSGIEKHKALVYLVRRNRDRFAANAVRGKVNGVYPAVHRRVVILAASGHANQLRFHVLGDYPNLLDVDFLADKSCQRCTGTDHHGGRSRNARASRRLGVRLQQEPLRRLEEAHQVRRKGMPILLRCHQSSQAGKAVLSSSVQGLQMDSTPITRCNLAGRQNIDCQVDGHRPRMEKVQRPKIEG